MITVSLPTPDARPHVGELPDDVSIVIWDGTGERPPGAEKIELFVGRYNAPPAPAEALAGLPQLRVVQLVSAGVEPWLPVVPDGVLLCNGRGVHGASTAELAVAGLLAIVRKLPRFLAAQAERRWDPDRDTAGLTGRRVLVVGAGDIGERIAAAARAFDAETTLVARHEREGVRAIGDLPDLLPAHDVVVLAVPHTPDTHRLVDAAFLAAMPDGGVLVNIARGSIVDTEALLSELQARRLHAFLDVTDPEPLPESHPLWSAPNLILTPHVGGGTRGWERRAYSLVRDQILRLHAGADLENQVTAGY
ncbi:MAG TPA: 2-hydroxyacid dehydrogenase [Jatrophihabitans sp.]|uniref:2-hydroxyacid dehydrogenase n=1 Tax=Jatrophihabitans sp. TaxID=1932789 RepID=UPI002DF7CE7D|nr:2-hydroxyacid dehydrogenase [Jatrophihabitans sp.]